MVEVARLPTPVTWLRSELRGVPWRLIQTPADERLTAVIERLESLTMRPGGSAGELRARRGGWVRWSAQIDRPGLLILAGVAHDDQPVTVERLARQGMDIAHP